MREEQAILNILKGEKFSTKKIEWQEFLKISDKNALSGIIYKKIKSSNIRIPLEVNLELKKFYIYNTKRNLILLNELKKILKTLESYKKNIVLIKGFSTLALTKQDLGERFLADIDFLCLKNEKEIMMKIKKLGYKQRENYSDKFYKKNFHHYKPLTKHVRGINVIIEIHHRLEQINSPFNIPINKIKKKMKLFDIETNILSTEDFLIHLCIQTSYDNFFLLGIRNLLDIKGIIKKQNLNWNKVIEKSKKWNCSSFVYKVLCLSKDLLNANVPEKTLKKIRNNSSNYQIFILSLAEKELFATRKIFLLTSKRWMLRILLGQNIKQKAKLFYEATVFLLINLKKKIKRTNRI